VLIVAGTGPDDLAAAVAALTEDLADAVVDAGEVGGDGPGPDRPPQPVPLAGRSVAVLNRGTPSGVVTSDGTLYMSLMRSCSAWPSGIWIDGDRRAAPDGSSFAWQHWSHTFEYALASGPGDWRTSGFSTTAEDYNHGLIAVAAGPGQPAAAAPGQAATDDAAGSEGSLLAVEPTTVVVSAVKPRGNPLASGRDPVTGADGEAEVTIRLRETAGIASTARVTLATSGVGPGDAGALGSLGAGVSAAWLTDLLEESDNAALPVEGGSVLVDISAFSTVTLVVRTSRRRTPARGGHEPAEPVQPVYARYWLHGKGPAPAGNLPVAAHFSPTRVALRDPGGAAELRLTVGCGTEAASGEVEIVTPGGLTVAPDRDLRYELAPGGYADWDLAVRAAPGTGTGRYFVAARIRHDLLIEDVAMVAVGERRWPDPALPPEEALELMLADAAAAAAEVELAVLTPQLRVAPGGRDELLVSVTSAAASELRGEAQVVSPFGTWLMLSPATQGFSIAPGAPTVLRFGVTAPATVRPGTRWWALVKVMYYGRVRYTEAIPVVIADGR